MDQEIGFAESRCITNFSWILVRDVAKPPFSSRVRIAVSRSAVTQRRGRKVVTEGKIKGHFRSGRQSMQLGVPGPLRLTLVNLVVHLRTRQTCFTMLQASLPFVLSLLKKIFPSAISRMSLRKKGNKVKT